MVNEVSITAIGDYQKITFSRNENEEIIDFSFWYPHGCAYASFELKDLLEAIKILNQKEALA